MLKCLAASVQQTCRNTHFQHLRRQATLSYIPNNVQMLYEKPVTSRGSYKLNQELQELLRKNMFGAARLILDQMHELDVEVQQHPLFEKPALSTLRTGRRDSSQEFTEWLQHAPDAHHPLARTSARTPFHTIYEWIFLRGVPAKKLPFVSEFGLLMASKGYHRHYVVEIARLQARFGSPERMKAYFVDAEQTALHYYASRRQPSPNHSSRVQPKRTLVVEDPILAARWYRQVAVEMSVAVKRFDEALFLLEQKRSYVLSDAMYQRFLDALPQEASSNYNAIIAEQVKRLRVVDAQRRILQGSCLEQDIIEG